ncbi:MAG TPA: hypothetical protein PLK76_01895 [bacterium]|nr:hypothetical protein [bacterium]
MSQQDERIIGALLNSDRGGNGNGQHSFQAVDDEEQQSHERSAAPQTRTRPGPGEGKYDYVYREALNGISQPNAVDDPIEGIARDFLQSNVSANELHHHGAIAQDRLEKTNRVLGIARDHAKEIETNGRKTIADLENSYTVKNSQLTEIGAAADSAFDLFFWGEKFWSLKQGSPLGKMAFLVGTLMTIGTFIYMAYMATPNAPIGVRIVIQLLFFLTALTLSYRRITGTKNDFSKKALKKETTTFLSIAVMIFDIFSEFVLIPLLLSKALPGESYNALGGWLGIGAFIFAVEITLFIEVNTAAGRAFVHYNDAVKFMNNVLIEIEEIKRTIKLEINTVKTQVKELFVKIIEYGKSCIQSATDLTRDVKVSTTTI